MGYYLPIHDYVSNQYANRIDRKRRYPDPVQAPEKILYTKKMTRENSEETGSDAVYSRSTVRTGKVHSPLEEKIIVDLTGKGKHVNESI